MPSFRGSCDFIALSNDSYRLPLGRGPGAFSTPPTWSAALPTMVLQLLGRRWTMVNGTSAISLATKGNRRCADRRARAAGQRNHCARREQPDPGHRRLRTYWSAKTSARRHGQIIGMIGISHDITEKRLEISCATAKGCWTRWWTTSIRWLI